eukprot:6151644-Pleurochrysis_carterae.AAC.1
MHTCVEQQVHACAGMRALFGLHAHTEKSRRTAPAHVNAHAHKCHAQKMPACAHTRTRGKLHSATAHKAALMSCGKH